MKKSLKKIGNANPVMTQRFGADPYAMVYEDRVYLYMTGDDFIYDETGEIKENNYSNIYTINVISSSDLVNWTDHGSVYAASEKGAASWGTNSWAPAAACREIDGKMKFFLYFANGGNGIAVLSSDSPTGPFTDPIQKPLVSRETPGCASVTWLFDPAVLVDGEEAYLYFGGGVPSPEQAANPGTARVAKLGKDMISLDGEPKTIENVSYLFEDSGINKINGKYIYSYCSNFSVPWEKKEELGFECGEIVTMEADEPMGPFKQGKGILKNPEAFFGVGGNNHHCMFEFHKQWYMAYHSRILEREMGVLKGYRSTNIDRVTISEDGTITPIQGTEKGVAQVGTLNPYERQMASTMAVMAGIRTAPYGENSVRYGSGDMIVTGISTGSWIGIYGASFGSEGAQEIQFEIRGKQQGKILVYMDIPEGKAVAEIEAAADSEEEFGTVAARLAATVTATHDIFFVFEGEGYELKSWKFC